MERMSLSNRVAVIGAVVGLVVYIGGDAQAGRGWPARRDGGVASVCFG